MQRQPVCSPPPCLPYTYVKYIVIQVLYDVYIYVWLLLVSLWVGRLVGVCVQLKSSSRVKQLFAQHAPLFILRTSIPTLSPACTREPGLLPYIRFSSVLLALPVSGLVCSTSSSVRRVRSSFVLLFCLPLDVMAGCCCRMQLQFQ